MRIGIMLRCLDEKGGISVYARNMVEELLKIDVKNDYFLFYRSKEHIGRYSKYGNVKERLVRGAYKAYWDQIAIPIACFRDRIDLIFHPKFTVPFFAPCKAVMVVHGADWFIPEQAKYYNSLDVQYIRRVMPFYFKKASVVISVSQLTTDNFYKVLSLPSDKVKTVYFGPANFFKPVKDKESLVEVKSRYKLPDNFIFTLTKYGVGGGNRKNIGNIFKAYEIYYKRTKNPYKLVIGGKDVHRYKKEYRVPDHGYGQNIFFPGYVEQVHLPAVYSLAYLYLYPSNLEAFPIPITEAMACGTPIITSNVNGLKEIAGDAALFVDPDNPEDIASAIERVLYDDKIAEKLSQKGLERSTLFCWKRCARETLSIFESISN